MFAYVVCIRDVTKIKFLALAHASKCGHYNIYIYKARGFIFILIFLNLVGHHHI